MEQKFYFCKANGTFAVTINDQGQALLCGGEPMNELKAGTTDGAHEKHVPVYTVENGTVHVTVGSVEHPMLEKHYIQWIAVQTKQGFQIKYLEPNTPPKADFALTSGDEVVAVYEYCNLHGLWKA